MAIPENTCPALCDLLAPSLNAQEIPLKPPRNLLCFSLIKTHSGLLLLSQAKDLLPKYLQAAHSRPHTALQKQPPKIPPLLCQPPLPSPAVGNLPITEDTLP